MKYLVEINNKTKKKFSKRKIRNVFAETVSLALVDEAFKAKSFNLSVALVCEAEIRLLNRQYRKKDSVTDVLSFAEYEGETGLLLKELGTGKQEVFLGELIICPAYVENNAKEDGETFEYAMTYIVSHGILHLLGFSHGEKMFSLQRAVADKLSKDKK